MWRMVAFALSVTLNVPSEVEKIPVGSLKSAAVPLPSAVPVWPLIPATVVTEPEEEIF
jgi:hypothetical protein